MKKRFVLLLPIRRLASMILALILVLSAILFVSAGAERSEIDSSDMAFAHWGMALTGQRSVKACTGNGAVFSCCALRRSLSLK